MKRSLLTFFLLLGLLGAGCTPHDAPTPTPTTTQPPVALTATIASVTGTVTLTPKDGNPQDAAAGAVIHPGDIIATGLDSGASLEFFSGARTALDENTNVVVDQVSIDPTQWTKQHIHLTLGAGRIWSRILKLLDASSSYDVGYDTVIASVRGTAYLLSGYGPQYQLDAFDGTVHLSSASTTGDVPSGFSAAFDTSQPPASIVSALTPTPDAVHNDTWVRQQLATDADFAARAVKARNERGTNETVGNIGQEAGPFTLEQPGVQHSGYHDVKITADGDLAVTSGATLQLHAFPEYADPTTGLLSQRDEITNQATWQASDSTMGQVDSNGVFHAAQNVNGRITVVARWNDSTHEHSGSIQLIVGSPAN